MSTYDIPSFYSSDPVSNEHVPQPEYSGYGGNASSAPRNMFHFGGNSAGFGTSGANVGLEELKGMTTMLSQMVQGLQMQVSTLTKNQAESLKLLSDMATVQAAQAGPYCFQIPKLCHKDCPNTKYWEKKTFIDAKNARGGTRIGGGALKGGAFFLEDINGVTCSPEVIESVRSYARSVWFYLRRLGMAPAVWSEAGVDAVNIYEFYMIRRFPFLAYGAENWKVTMIATDSYPSWYSNHSNPALDLDGLETMPIKEEPTPKPISSKAKSVSSTARKSSTSSATKSSTSSATKSSSSTTKSASMTTQPASLTASTSPTIKTSHELDTPDIQMIDADSAESESTLLDRNELTKPMEPVGLTMLSDPPTASSSSLPSAPSSPTISRTSTKRPVDENNDEQPSKKHCPSSPPKNPTKHIIRKPFDPLGNLSIPTIKVVESESGIIKPGVGLVREPIAMDTPLPVGQEQSAMPTPVPVPTTLQPNLVPVSVTQPTPVPVSVTQPTPAPVSVTQPTPAPVSAPANEPSKPRKAFARAGNNPKANCKRAWVDIVHGSETEYADFWGSLPPEIKKTFKDISDRDVAVNMVNAILNPPGTTITEDTEG